MPPGTPYNSFIVPYPIRVDEFSVPRDGSLAIAALHLLTHTHSDHVIGLNAKSFGSTVICSTDAKEMLLRHETYSARFLKEQEVHIERIRTFSHLKTSKEALDIAAHNNPHAYDLLRDLPLEVPTDIEISNNEWVTITLIDANHCPGSVMFLVEGSRGAILHTGDFRAEPIFINAIMKNPFLRPFLAPTSGGATSRKGVVQKTLEAIYLDTASMLRMCEVPTKKEATDGLVELMLSYPSHTRFFINSWTWGYEDILKVIFLTFRSKIHVDRYKYDVYTSLSDPVLRELVTRDLKSTRFHACERFDRCALVRPDDPSVVYINPVGIGCDNWNLYLAKMRVCAERGKRPTFLLVPLHRHSPLPELQSFVKLFRPKRLVPNFLMPGLKGIDWACMPSMFGPCMAEGGADRIRDEMDSFVTLEGISELNSELPIENTEIANLEGGNAEEELTTLVGVWASVPGADSGRSTTGSLIHQMQRYLPKGISLLIDRALRTARMAKLPQVYVESGGEDTDTSDDEDGARRTAELLFGGHLNLPRSNDSPLSSPVSAKSIASLSDRNRRSPLQIHKNKPLNVDLTTVKIPITPPSSSRSVHQVHIRIGDNHKASNQHSNQHSMPSLAVHNKALGSPLQLGPRRKSHDKQSVKIKATTSKSPLSLSIRTNLLEDRLASSDTSEVYASTRAALLSGEVIEATRSGAGLSLSSASLTFRQERRHDTSSTSAISQVHLKPLPASCHSRKRPLSPELSQKKVQVKRIGNSDRFDLAEKLSIARPDLVTQETEWEVEMDSVRASVGMACAMLTGPDEGDEDDDGDDGDVHSASSADSDARKSNSEPRMNWDRSRRLQQAIIDDLRHGRPPQLPALKFVLDGLFGEA